MLFKRIFKELNAHNVRYLIVGGIAVNLHGFARATGDLDILISFDEDNVARFLSAVKAMGFTPAIPVDMGDFADPQKRGEWATTRNMKVFSVQNPQNPMEQLDVLLETSLDFEEMYNNKQMMKTGDTDIPVCSIDDLIKLKGLSNRERDDWDIENLKKIKEIKGEA